MKNTNNKKKMVLQAEIEVCLIVSVGYELTKKNKNNTAAALFFGIQRMSAKNKISGILISFLVLLFLFWNNILFPSIFHDFCPKTQGK